MRTLSFLVFIVCLFNAPSRYATAQTVTLQAIHNAADPVTSPISVWVGVPVLGSTSFIQAISTFTFRTATPALTGLGSALPSLSPLVGVSTRVNLTATGNISATSPPPLREYDKLQLQQGANFVFVRGVLTTGNFAPNPQGKNIAFGLAFVSDTLKSFTNNDVRIMTYHSATDVPAIDLVIREQSFKIAENISFDDIMGIVIPVGDYTMDIREAGTNKVLGSFSAPLRTNNWGGKRIIILLSGFLTPSKNNNGLPLGLLAVVNSEESVGGNGITKLFASAPPPTSVAGQQAENPNLTIAIHPNPSQGQSVVEFSSEHAGEAAIHIINSIGQVVYRTNVQWFNAGKHSIPLELHNLPHGFYQVRIEHAKSGMAVRGLLLNR